MKWTGERYKCRKCGEVYPYSLSKCSCGGICDKIADAPLSSLQVLGSGRSILSRILESEKQKEQDKVENELARLYNAVDKACSKDEYYVAITHLERILEITPDSKEAKDLLDFCKKKTDQLNEQFKIGLKYAKGEGVQQNYAKAAKCFTKAAEQGHAGAQFLLGVLYDKGNGVSQDYTEAIKWYRKAAEQGFPDAQERLGFCYAKGYGVSQNYTEAVKLFTKAAEQGCAKAQNNLGVSYFRGNGVPQSYAEAVKWYRKAAEQGDADAQNNLGICYRYGKGVPRNLAEAQKWRRKAADQGFDAAKLNLDSLTGRG